MESTTEQTMEAMSSLESGGNVSADDWFKGIALSVLASIIGGASKLAIRKSWLMQRESQRADGEVNSEDHDENTSPQLLTLDDVGESTDSSQNVRVIPQWIPYCLRYSAMFGMSVLNPICCVLAMNYASPSILAPFSGLTLVWVILFSHPVVGEKPTNPQVIAALLIITGEVIVAVFGDHTNDAGVTVEDVVSIIVSWFIGESNKTCKTTRTHQPFPKARILRSPSFCDLFRCANCIHGASYPLDFALKESHSSKICLGFFWWCNDWITKLFERFVDHNQGNG